MQVYLDENEYVSSYAIIGDLVDGIEVSTPQNLSYFEQHYQAYRVVSGCLVFDEEKEQELELEAQKAELRKLRQIECFSVIDRSRLWYDNLTEDQLAELKSWYDAWLAVTETMIIPTKPSWLS